VGVYIVGPVLSKSILTYPTPLIPPHDYSPTTPYPFLSFILAHIPHARYMA
jgi:hypothetical protein